MLEEKNIKLIIAYDGTGYFGWQRQVDRPTIQGAIEGKIATMAGRPISLIASGRTDAGVHAFYQVANFRVFSGFAPTVFLRVLNSKLPRSIRIIEAEQVHLNFHARFDAKSKVYEYRVYNDPVPSPFLRNYAWHVPGTLDRAVMRECLGIITGIHDFSSFRSAGDGNQNPVRDMMKTQIVTGHGNLLSFTFEANGFLRHMVRNIMGTIIRVGIGKIDSARFKEIVESKDRHKAGAMAPPGGLYLKYVRY